MFASLTDIQAWIQSDKIQIDDANSQKQNINATRIVKGLLAGFFSPIIIASWADPDTTPEQIREIAGRLTAAFVYASVYTEESGGEVSAYAQWLYAGALAEIQSIVNGNITIIGVSGDPVDASGESLLSFFPDDTTVPAFTMGDFFA